MFDFDSFLSKYVSLSISNGESVIDTETERGIDRGEGRERGEGTDRGEGQIYTVPTLRILLNEQAAVRGECKLLWLPLDSITGIITPVESEMKKN